MTSWEDTISMAYRRSIFMRAKLLCQQQRFAPLFTCIHNASDEKQLSYASETHSVYKRYPFASGWLSSLACFTVPMTYRLAFVRNMTTRGPTDAVAEVGVISDVAPELFVDSAIQTMIPQGSGNVFEVVVGAADSIFPLAALQYMIDYVHAFTGLNWWASIAAATILIKFLALPLMMEQLKATSKYKGSTPTAITEARAKMQALIKEHGVTPLTPMKGILIQSPVFISFFLAVSNMAENVPSLKHGGAFWFVDLTSPDCMKILPVLTSMTVWIMYESYLAEGGKRNPAIRTLFNASVFSALMVPFISSFPAAIFCYWISSNVFWLMYGMVIRSPEGKKFLDIPMTSETPAWLTSEFIERVNRLVEGAKALDREMGSQKDLPASLVERLRSFNEEVEGLKEELGEDFKTFEEEMKSKRNMK